MLSMHPFHFSPDFVACTVAYMHLPNLNTNTAFIHSLATYLASLLPNVLT